jgi:hypothetical protein
MIAHPKAEAGDAYEMVDVTIRWCPRHVRVGLRPRVVLAHHSAHVLRHASAGTPVVARVYDCSRQSHL